MLDTLHFTLHTVAFSPLTSVYILTIVQMVISSYGYLLLLLGGCHGEDHYTLTGSVDRSVPQEHTGQLFWYPLQRQVPTQLRQE